MVDINKLIKIVDETRSQCPEWRYGQTVFNVAYQLYPEATDRLRGTEYDCFYNDKKVNSFLEKLSE